MIRTITHLWVHHRLTLIAFSLALGLTLFFAGRLAWSALYWTNPAHQQQSPEHWMTPGYVARSWAVDPRDVVATLGLDPDTIPRGQTLEDIARTRGVAVDVLIAELAAFLATARP